MDNRNVVFNVSKDATLKSASKHNESKPTQVFVLPPELLKGLLIGNKIPKLNVASTLEILNTTKQSEPVKNEKLTIKNVAAVNADETSKTRQDKAADSRENQNSKNSNEKNKNSTCNSIEKKNIRRSARTKSKNKEIEKQNTITNSFDNGKLVGSQKNKRVCVKTNKLHTRSYKKSQDKVNKSSFEKIDYVELSESSKASCSNEKVEKNRITTDDILSKNEKPNTKNHSKYLNENNMELPAENNALAQSATIIKTSNNEEKLSRVRKKSNINIDIFNNEKLHGTLTIDANQENEKGSSQFTVSNKKDQNKDIKIFDKITEKGNISLIEKPFCEKNFNESIVTSAKQTVEDKNELIDNETTEIYEEIEFIVEEIMHIEEPTEHEEYSHKTETLNVVDHNNYENEKKPLIKNAEFTEFSQVNQINCEKNFHGSSQIVTKEKDTKNIKVYVNKRKIKKQINNDQHSNICNSLAAGSCTAVNNVNLYKSLEKSDCKEGMIKVNENNKTEVEKQTLSTVANSFLGVSNLSEPNCIPNKNNESSKNVQVTDFIETKNAEEKVGKSVSQVKGECENISEIVYDEKQNTSSNGIYSEINTRSEEDNKEVHNKMKIISSRYRSKSIHHFTFNETEIKSTRTRSRSLNMDVDSHYSQIMNLKHSSNLRETRSKSDKMLRERKNCKFNIIDKKENVNYSKTLAINENRSMNKEIFNEVEMKDQNNAKDQYITNKDNKKHHIKIVHFQNFDESSNKAAIVTNATQSKNKTAVSRKSKECNRSVTDVNQTNNTDDNINKCENNERIYGLSNVLCVQNRRMSENNSLSKKTEVFTSRSRSKSLSLNTVSGTECNNLTYSNEINHTEKSAVIESNRLNIKSNKKINDRKIHNRSAVDVKDGTEKMYLLNHCKFTYSRNNNEKETTEEIASIDNNEIIYKEKHYETIDVSVSEQKYPNQASNNKSIVQIENPSMNDSVLHETKVNEVQIENIHLAESIHCASIKEEDIPCDSENNKKIFNKIEKSCLRKRSNSLGNLIPNKNKVKVPIIRSKSINLDLNSEYSSIENRVNSLKLNKINDNRENVIIMKYTSEKSDTIAEKLGQSKISIYTEESKSKNELNNVQNNEILISSEEVPKHKILQVSSDLEGTTKILEYNEATKQSCNIVHKVIETDSDQRVTNYLTTAEAEGKNNNILETNIGTQNMEGDLKNNYQVCDDSKKEEPNATGYEVENSDCNNSLSIKLLDEVIHETIFSEIRPDTSKYTSKSHNRSEEDEEDSLQKKCIAQISEEGSPNYSISTVESTVNLNNNMQEDSLEKNNMSIVLNENQINEDLKRSNLYSVNANLVTVQKKRRGRSPKLPNSINKSAENLTNKNFRKCFKRNDHHLKDEAAKKDIFKSSSIDSEILKKRVEEESDETMNTNGVVEAAIKENAVANDSFFKIHEATVNSIITKETNKDKLDEITTNFTITQKKKKGRAPKSASLIKKSLEESTNENTAILNNDIENSVTTRRGKIQRRSSRFISPELDKNIVNKETLNESVADDTMSTPSITIDKDSKSEDITRDKEINDKEMSKPSNSQKKRRGRPPKSIMSEPGTSTNKFTVEVIDHNKPNYLHQEIDYNEHNAATDTQFKNEESTKVVLNVNTAQKKRTGRPPKSAISKSIIFTKETEKVAINGLDTNIDKSITANEVLEDINKTITDSNNTQKTRRGRSSKLEIFELPIYGEKIDKEVIDKSINNKFRALDNDTASNAKNNSHEDIFDSNIVQQAIHPKSDVELYDPVDKDDVKVTHEIEYNHSVTEIKLAKCNKINDDHINKDITLENFYQEALDSNKILSRQAGRSAKQIIPDTVVDSSVEIKSNEFHVANTNHLEETDTTKQHLHNAISDSNSVERKRRGRPPKRKRSQKDVSPKKTDEIIVHDQVVDDSPLDTNINYFFKVKEQQSEINAVIIHDQPFDHSSSEMDINESQATNDYFENTDIQRISSGTENKPHVDKDDTAKENSYISISYSSTVQSKQKEKFPVHEIPDATNSFDIPDDKNIYNQTVDSSTLEMNSNESHIANDHLEDPDIQRANFKIEIKSGKKEETAEEISHESISQPSSVQKKRRGRPPKRKIQDINNSIDTTNEKITNNQILDDSTLDTNTNEFHTTNNNQLVDTGRRKRSSRFSGINDTSDSESDFMPVAKKKCLDQKNLVRRGRPPRILKPANVVDMVDGKGLSDDNYSESEDDENYVRSRKRRKCSFNVYKERKRGRPKGRQCKKKPDDDYVPHYSQLRQFGRNKNKKLNTSAEPTVKKMVTCGKCKVQMAKNQWLHHNLSQHNDLGWIEGTPKPDFENDEKLVKRVLFNAIKRKKSGFTCESCNIVKRSVLGFLSHITFCGKNEEEIQALMVTCPVCKAVTKPSSLEYHERMHKMQAEEKQRTTFPEIETAELGKVKRKAAEKAVSKISELTALVKDDKDNTLPQDKKIKLNAKIKKLIQKPQFAKRIPSSVLSKWNRDMNNGNNAVCTQVGCQFASNSLDEIKQHYSMCNFTPRENFVCKICQFQSLIENEVVDHALEKHPTEDFDDTNMSISDAESYTSENLSETGDNSDKNQGLLKKFFFKESTDSSNKMFKFLFKSGACHTKFNRSFSTAFKWTLEFELQNYKLNLFEEYVPNIFELLSIEESRQYLPELDESMLVKSAKIGNQKSAETEWKKWRRFEGEYVQDNPTFFVGGPIWALAWLPIPSSLAFSQNVSQYLAVSTHPTMDSEYSIGKAYSGKNIIQIWNLGDLNHKTNDKYNPELAYAITHEGGTVWCLDWCPSGCYEHEDLPGFVEESSRPRRMGLLAAACSDGCIRIYSLIFPDYLPSPVKSESIRDSENVYPIYKTEPVLILVVNSGMYYNKQQDWQVTKLSWTKEKRHNVIVAGFSNGYVALWDLSTKSPILKFKRGNTVFLTPYRHFLAHHHAITMVYLIPRDNKRFLATGSFDRYFKFWDLENVTSPRNSLKKSFITDGSWLNHWCCALIAYDDALSLHHSYSYCLPLREYTYKYYNILPTNSASYTIATSDFGNSIANGTLAGEVLAMFPQQLIYVRDMDKILPRKRFISMVSSSEVVDFQAAPNNKELKAKEGENKDDKTEYNFMPSTYKDSKDRFGIKFCDKMNNFRDECAMRRNYKKTLTCDMMQSVQIEQYPFMSANRVSWNPNAWSFLWLAVGYQSGFVRLISFKSLATTTEWNKLLTAHIDTLKSEVAATETTKIDGS